MVLACRGLLVWPRVTESPAGQGVLRSRKEQRWTPSAVVHRREKPPRTRVTRNGFRKAFLLGILMGVSLLDRLDGAPWWVCTCFPSSCASSAARNS